MIGTCTVALASLVTVATVARPVFHSVQHYDNAVHVTQSVLNRSYCKAVERVHPLTTEQGAERVAAKVALDRQAQIESGVAHCQNRLRADGKNENECRLQD